MVTMPSMCVQAMQRKVNIHVQLHVVDAERCREKKHIHEQLNPTGIKTL